MPYSNEHRPGSAARTFRLLLAIAFGAGLGLLLYYGYGDRVREVFLGDRQTQATGSSIYTEAPRPIQEVLR